MRSFSVVAITSNPIGRDLMFPTVEVGVSLIVNNLKALKQSSQVKDVRLSTTEDDTPRCEHSGS